MIRISRLTDYSVVLMAHFAAEPQRPVRNARDLAARARVPAPTVSKILKVLSKAELLVSHRGVKGGYSLARPPDHISVAQIIEAVEGNLGLTACNSSRGCSLERLCPARSAWGRVNGVIRSALEGLRLSELGALAASAYAESEHEGPRTAARRHLTEPRVALQAHAAVGEVER